MVEEGRHTACQVWWRRTRIAAAKSLRQALQTVSAVRAIPNLRPHWTMATRGSRDEREEEPAACDSIGCRRTSSRAAARASMAASASSTAKQPLPKKPPRPMASAHSGGVLHRWPSPAARVAIVPEIPGRLPARAPIPSSTKRASSPVRHEVTVTRARTKRPSHPATALTAGAACHAASGNAESQRKSVNR